MSLGGIKKQWNKANQVMTFEQCVNIDTWFFFLLPVSLFYIFHVRNVQIS